MENQTTNQNFGNQPAGQVTLPNSTGALVLGIIGLVFSIICHPVTFIMGLIMSIIAVVLAGKAVALYNADPSLYKPANLSSAKAGKVMGIIGMVLAFVWLIVWILVIVGIMNHAFYDFDFR